jgi:hypothetical protein
VEAVAAGGSLREGRDFADEAPGGISLGAVLNSDIAKDTAGGEVLGIVAVVDAFEAADAAGAVLEKEVVILELFIRKGRYGQEGKCCRDKQQRTKHGHGFPLKQYRSSGGA